MRSIPATPELCPPSRRSLIAGVVPAVVALTAGPGSAVAIGEKHARDDEFLAVFAEWRRAFAAGEALPVETPEEVADIYWKKVVDLRARINKMHVHTPAAAAVKAKFVLANMCGTKAAYDWAAYDSPIDSADFTDEAEAAMLSLILDIDRMAEVRHV